MMIENTDSQWIENAIRDMRQSAYYADHVLDEWYETLPVPLIRENSVWILISFGKTTAGNSPPTRMPLGPHLSYSIEYPTRRMSWQNVIPKTFTPVEMPRLNPTENPPTRDIMGLRRTYYQSLSQVLSANILSITTPESIKPADCSAVMAMRDSLLAAANPNLLWYYTQSTGTLQNWLQSFCGDQQSAE